MPNGKPFAKPSFGELLRNYPTEATAFGEGGTIINNSNYEHTCALRLSVALTRWNKDLMNEFTGNMARDTARSTTLPYARGAKALADYLKADYVMWSPMRLGSFHAAMRLREQGIIFWTNTGTVDHIDLFAGASLNLPAGRRRSMLWAPQRHQFVHAAFWRLG